MLFGTMNVTLNVPMQWIFSQIEINALFFDSIQNGDLLQARHHFKGSTAVLITISEWRWCALGPHYSDWIASQPRVNSIIFVFNACYKVIDMISYLFAHTHSAFLCHTLPFSILVCVVYAGMLCHFRLAWIAVHLKLQSTFTAINNW